MLVDDDPDRQAVADQFLLVARQHLDGLTQALRRRSAAQEPSQQPVTSRAPRIPSPLLRIRRRNHRPLATRISRAARRRSAAPARAAVHRRGKDLQPGRSAPRASRQYQGSRPRHRRAVTAESGREACVLGLGGHRGVAAHGNPRRELLELTHHSLVQYRLPSTGELGPGRYCSSRRRRPTPNRVGATGRLAWAGPRLRPRSAPHGIEALADRPMRLDRLQDRVCSRASAP